MADKSQMYVTYSGAARHSAASPECTGKDAPAASLESFGLEWLRQVCGWRSDRAWQVAMLQSVLIAKMRCALAQAGRDE
jgi:hypothetical protein